MHVQVAKQDLAIQLASVGPKRAGRCGLPAGALIQLRSIDRSCTRRSASVELPGVAVANRVDRKCNERREPGEKSKKNAQEF